MDEKCRCQIAKEEKFGVRFYGIEMNLEPMTFRKVYEMY